MLFLFMILIGFIIGLIVSRLLDIKNKCKENEILKIVDRIITTELEKTTQDIKKKESGKDT